MLERLLRSLTGLLTVALTATSANAQPIALPAGPGVSEYDTTNEGMTFFVSLD